MSEHSGKERIEDPGATASGAIRIVEQWPLPLNQDRVDDFVEYQPFLKDIDSLHVDELNDEPYVNELARNREWVVFRTSFSTGVFVWNHAYGEGVHLAEAEEGFFQNFAECIARSVDTDSYRARGDAE